MTPIDSRVAVLESKHDDVMRMHAEVLKTIKSVKEDIIGVLDQHASSSQVRCEMRHRDINNRFRSAESRIEGRSKMSLAKWQVVATIVAAMVSGIGASFATSMFHGGGQGHVAAAK